VRFQWPSKPGTAIAHEALVTAVQPMAKVGRPSIAAPWAARIET
jgi:hypothetical protein